MKKLLLLLLLLPTICLGQTKDDLFYLIDKFPVDKSGNINFYTIDSVNNVNRGSLYLRATEAIDYYFKNAPSTTIPIYDDVNNLIIYKGKFVRYERTQKTFSTILNTHIYRFTLKVECIDNKFTIEVYDISETVGDFTIMLSDLLDKKYYNKAKLTSSSLKAKYNTIYFIYNYLTNKIKSIDEYMKRSEKKNGK